MRSHVYYRDEKGAFIRVEKTDVCWRDRSIYYGAKVSADGSPSGVVSTRVPAEVLAHMVEVTEADVPREWLSWFNPGD